MNNINFIKRHNIHLINAPSPFDGIWFHWTNCKNEIFNIGWNPLLNEKSIYGTAVYFTKQVKPRNHWGGEKIECVFQLSPDAVIESFPPSNNQDNLIKYFNDNGIYADKCWHNGSHEYNIEKRNFFLKKNIDAIYFIENYSATIAVYNINVIRVIIE